MCVLTFGGPDTRFAGPALPPLMSLRIVASRLAPDMVRTGRGNLRFVIGVFRASVHRIRHGLTNPVLIVSRPLMERNGMALAILFQPWWGVGLRCHARFIAHFPCGLLPADNIVPMSPPVSIRERSKRDGVPAVTPA